SFISLDGAFGEVMVKGRSSANEPGGTLKKSNVPHSHDAGGRGRAQRDASGHPAALWRLRPPRLSTACPPPCRLPCTTGYRLQACERPWGSRGRAGCPSARCED